MTTLTRIVVVLLACAVVSGCRAPEDPVRVALRARLQQDKQLSSEDLARLIAEVRRAIAGKTVLLVQGGGTREMDDEQRAVVLGMLTDPVGLYDEGKRTAGGRTLRVLNAPGRSLNEEVEAARKLLVDAETFQPRRF